MTSQVWDAEYDVVVVGSGAGGLAAAITAAAENLRVLIVEKTDRIGGSTAVSGGAVWAPLNTQTSKAGHEDTAERVYAYMRNVVGDAAPLAMQKAFLDAAPAMIEWFEANTEVKLNARVYSPDYYPDREGAALGGRSMDPLVFDGRLLGKHFRCLRDPLPEFVVLGGMMVTMADVKHLLAVTRSIESFSISLKLVLRYFVDRLSGYHRGTRLVLGNALAARLFKSALDRNIPYWLNSPLRQLHLEADRVVGVTVVREERPIFVRARRGVVVATGGFPWSESLRQAHYPQPTGSWSMAPQSNSGDGITCACAVGATLGEGHVSPAFWTPVSILKRSDGSQLLYPHLVWDRAKPGLMAVNGAGERFVNESTSYHEFVNGMYRSHQVVPTFPAFLICDSPFIERWGLGLALPGGRPREHLIRAGYLFKADSLDALAAKLELDAATLARSVERFNRWAELGFDEDFGKGSTD